MNRSSFALLGSIVLATAGLTVTTSAPSNASNFSLQAGKVTETQLSQQLFAQQPEAVQLPESVIKAVLEDAAQRTGMKASELQVLQAAQQTWSDGCLGISGGGACTQAQVPGWAVIVASDKEAWVYRTNESGSVVKWDEASTQKLAAEIAQTQVREERTTRSTETTEQVTQRTETRSASTGNFSLTVLQPSGNLSEVITRVSLKEKKGKSFGKEKFVGDFKYKLKQKAKFVKGINPGDRVVVRLYDLQNRLIGFSEFECLTANSAVTLILSEQPTQYKVVRTVYGIDADEDGSIDKSAAVYDYFTQVSGSAGQEQVTFLSSTKDIQISQFQTAEVRQFKSISYSSSFSSGEYAVSSKSMSVYESGLAEVLTAVPGKVVEVVDVAAGEVYEVGQLAAKYADALLSQGEVETTRTIQTSFMDVSESHWARSFIAELAALEIVEGFPDGKFRPDQPVTKAQFAAMLRKAIKKGKIRDAISFSDVSSSYWAYSAIRDAFEMGFFGLTASNNQFFPTRNLTRLDVLTALAKGMNYSVSNTNQVLSLLQVYNDYSAVPNDVRALIAAATQRGLVVNYPNVKLLQPNKTATRAEVCAFLYQALVSMGEAKSISSQYVVGLEEKVREAGGAAVDAINNEVPGDNREMNDDQREKPRRQACNQGVGNGAEGCDPGNSNRNRPSNDEGGGTPGSPGRQGGNR